MKKQELIHLHGLIAEVTHYCEMHDGVSVDLTDYQSVGTKPTSIHQSKGDHKDAVFALIEGLTDAIPEERVVRVSPNVE